MDELAFSIFVLPALLATSGDDVKSTGILEKLNSI